MPAATCKVSITASNFQSGNSFLYGAGLFKALDFTSAAVSYINTATFTQFNFDGSGIPGAPAAASIWQLQGVATEVNKVSGSDVAFAATFTTPSVQGPTTTFTFDRTKGTIVCNPQS